MSKTIMSDKNITEISISNISKHNFSTNSFLASSREYVREHIPRNPPLIHGILDRTEKMMIAAPQKGGKSFLILNLAVAIPTGGEWLGHRCECGNVFICNLENDINKVYDRLEEICERRSVDKDIIDRHIKVTAFKFTPTITELVNELISNIEPGMYSAIIIDSAYNILGGRESQAEDATVFMNEMDRLALSLQASVIICHHTKKPTEHYLNEYDRVAGSNIFTRKVDTLMVITKVYDKEDYKLVDISTKARYTAGFKKLKLKLQDSIFTTVESKPEEKNSNYKKPMNSKEKKTDSFIKAFNTIKDSEGKAKISAIANYMGKDRSTIKRYVNSTPGFTRNNGYIFYSETT